MTRTPIILIFLIFSTLTTCDFPDKKVKLKSDISLESKFEQLTNEVRAKNTTINFRLDSLTNFPWDTVIILTPYSQIEQFENKLNIDLTEIKKTQIVSDDVSNVLVFIKNGQLINYVDLPRNKGDFVNMTDSINVIPKGNCRFSLIQTNKIFVSGQTIVKVISQHVN
jgi:hypothetical protein